MGLIRPFFWTRHLHERRLKMSFISAPILLAILGLMNKDGGAIGVEKEDYPAICAVPFCAATMDWPFS